MSADTVLLPPPLMTKMDRINVHKLFGEPYESKESIKILRYRGYGGSDIYRMDDFGYPSVYLGFQYRNDDMVCSLRFYLNNTRHNLTCSKNESRLNNNFPGRNAWERSNHAGLEKKGRCTSATP
ncbi:DUF6392 family protein [Pseudomonas khavaziana]|uniref:DUF6392 family protein n=1 Tax=Pseudomonas khavaziana TaxID=2842351 RepID=UPI003BB0DCEE